jgi:hypothetical protein
MRYDLANDSYAASGNVAGEIGPQEFRSNGHGPYERLSKRVNPCSVVQLAELDSERKDQHNNGNNCRAKTGK